MGAEEQDRRRGRERNPGQPEIERRREERQRDLEQRERHERHQRHAREAGERPVAQFLAHVHQGLAVKALAIDELQDQERRHQVDRGRQRQMPEKLDERIVHAAVDRHQKILRVADRAHDAAERHAEGEREQQDLGRHPVLFRQQQHERRADDGEGIVHEERRGGPRSEENHQDQAVGRPGAAERPIGKVEQVPAFLERLPDDEHPEQEQHHVRIDGVQRRRRADLSGGEHRGRPQQHDQPDRQPQPPDPPHGDEDEYQGQDDNGNRHGGSLVHGF